MTQAITTSRPAIRALTGLRAVAALAVLVHHLGVPQSAPGTLEEISRRGYIGVPLFFMLSGFVLAYNYSDLAPRDGRAVARFWSARIARVMPLYWLVLAVAVVERSLRGTDQDSSLWMQISGVQAWSSDVGIAGGMYNPVGWSISVELFLYALFPLAVVLVSKVADRAGNAGLVVIVGLIVAVQVVVWAVVVSRGWADLPSTSSRSAHRILYRTPVTRLAEFVVGMCLALLFVRGARLTRSIASVVQVGAASIVLIACALGGRSSGALNAAYYGVLWTVPFALLIYSLASDEGVVARGLRTPVMVRLGAASYALYLTHWKLLHWIDPDGLDTATGLSAYAEMFGLIALGLLVAELMHRFVEQPCRRWLMRLIRRRRMPVMTSAV